MGSHRGFVEPSIGPFLVLHVVVVMVLVVYLQSGSL
jgi:hypothetical protein